MSVALYCADVVCCSGAGMSLLQCVVLVQVCPLHCVVLVQLCSCCSVLFWCSYVPVAVCCSGAGMSLLQCVVLVQVCPCCSVLYWCMYVPVALSCAGACMSLWYNTSLFQVDARDSRGRSPLGVAMWAGHSTIVATLQHEKLQLTDEGDTAAWPSW